MTKKTCLIVEDDPNIAEAEQTILEEDYEVIMARDGEEGLAKAKETNPDVIVLDIMMPKKSGYEVCKELRAGEYKGKIVMVTAKDQEKDEAEGMDLGADDYIMKPFEAVELLHVVNQVLKY